jgi:hypothetical protein
MTETQSEKQTIRGGTVMVEGDFESMPDAKAWAVLNRAIKRAAEERGYRLSRVPGRGRSNMWRVERDGQVQKASFRTTKDRWIAFVPLKGGAEFKTLKDVDLVLVAAVDDPSSPRQIQVYEFPAGEVRRRFKENYEARVRDGRAMPDNFGMWVSLDRDDRDTASSVGSGLADKYKPIAVYQIASLREADVSADEEEVRVEEAEVKRRLFVREPTTIAEVLDAARDRISEIAGVERDAVKLDLKIEY